MTELIYLKDSYKKELDAKVLSINASNQGYDVVLDRTIFYPQGGGQPSDRGIIRGKHGTLHVKHVRIDATGRVIHEGTLDGVLTEAERIIMVLDWTNRYTNMRIHTAGHIVHEAVMATVPTLVPTKADHGIKPFIMYKGSITADKNRVIETRANEIVDRDLVILTEFVSYKELAKRSSFVPSDLPKNKPLRIMTINGYQPIPDGGTQVYSTKEVGQIVLCDLIHDDPYVKVYYQTKPEDKKYEQTVTGIDAHQETIDTAAFISELIEIQARATEYIQSAKSKNTLPIDLLGKNSDFGQKIKQLRSIQKQDRQRVGIVINEVKRGIEHAICAYEQTRAAAKRTKEDWYDITIPGIQPPHGHLHIVSQAIEEITHIFERIGFTRVRHPEVDWDWYAFESLNMPPNHPARDEWETFFIKTRNRGQGTGKNKKFSKMVLTPHTSNGQVREMEKGKLPIRMINIAKCYRRQSDVSHAPMFHQFEGLYVDEHVSIAYLKGVIDFFVKQFYGPERKIRLRPFHFQFTEPSFEIDVTCGICLGKAVLPDGKPCRLCKEGWLELGGAGMVHPNVLTAGGIDPKQYSGFAFGWGVERTYMMKSGTKIDDVRLLYSNDIRFLEQF